MIKIALEYFWIVYSKDFDKQQQIAFRAHKNATVYPRARRCRGPNAVLGKKQILVLFTCSRV